ncbi:hypothetical protein PISMIDRAFT_11247 [Pisolithus microcarpus 441]|uniref:Uncharacterized protein n=1 Tax=Pisolithus microcarpus 441 TaxID=765257 RepID=A0A0C9ZTK7_9AGAM|nr:hypothetical protein BKA83DRAFT_11247 [Pisolithus microcarpus]KIK22988.1 hypothetical protein PISMIDRAFT_11247 [Pisolithus microcarpus 441]
MANTHCDKLSDEVGIIHVQKNVPWWMLLDLLYLHQFTLVDWPTGVSAVSADFNVKHLNTDEPCSLIVPFLKEQMGVDYMLEAPAGDEEDVADEGLVPVPKSSFYLMDWTPDPKMFDIPLVIDTYNQLLHLLSDSQAFLKGLLKGMNQPPIDGASTSVDLPLPSSLPLPPSPPPPLSLPLPPSPPPPPSLPLPPSSPPPLSSPPTRPSPSPPRSHVHS